MKKLLLIPALVLFATAPALAQNPSAANPANSDIGLSQTTKEGAKESQMGSGATATPPSAPSQIKNSESERIGSTPTNENRDEIKKPAGQ